MPWSASGQPCQGEPPPADGPVFGQGIHRVSAAGRHEATRCRSQRRDHVAVEPDGDDHQPGDPAARGTRLQQWRPHRCCPGSAARCRPPTCCSAVSISSCSRVNSASRLPGRARMTIRSAGCNCGRTARAACRSRRATRCRWTAFPTALLTTNPIRGPRDSAGTVQEWITRARCATRRPDLIVVTKSADRVIRYRAGSTWMARSQAVSERRPLRRRPVTIARPALVRIRRRKPWTFDRRRLLGW